MHWADENVIIREKPLADEVVAEEQEGILFWLSEAPFSKSSLLGYEEKEEESGVKPCLKIENSYVAESPCIFPLQNLGIESDAEHLLTENLSLLDDDPRPNIISTSESTLLDGNFFFLISHNKNSDRSRVYFEKKKGKQFYCLYLLHYNNLHS